MAIEKPRYQWVPTWVMIPPRGQVELWRQVMGDGYADGWELRSIGPQVAHDSLRPFVTRNTPIDGSAQRLAHGPTDIVMASKRRVDAVIMALAPRRWKSLEFWLLHGEGVSPQHYAHRAVLHSGGFAPRFVQMAVENELEPLTACYERRVRIG